MRIRNNDHSYISEDEDTQSDMSSEFGESSGKEEDQRDEVKEMHKLAQKETARVHMRKLLVLVSILAAAALVSAGT
jgi:hypothetical protein